MKMKRVIAWIGIIILLSLYVITFIAACISSPKSNSLFWASVFCTVMVPIVMHIILRLHEHVVKNRDDIIEEVVKAEEEENDDKE